MAAAVETGTGAAVREQLQKDGVGHTAINDDSLVVKAAGGEGEALVMGTDYDSYYDDGELVIELLEDGAAYEAPQVNIAYSKVTPEAVTATDVSMAFEAIDLCMSSVGVIPDLLLAPGYSGNSVIAAVMTTRQETSTA